MNISLYIAPTSWGYATYKNRTMIPGTERETKEEAEEVFAEVLENEKKKWRNGA